MIGAVQQAIAAELDGTGVHVVTDPALVVPPCAYVAPATFDRLTGTGYGATVDVYLVAAAPTGTAAAIAQLDTMLAPVLAALDPDRIAPTVLQLGSTGDNAPALQLTCERTVTP